MKTLTPDRTEEFWQIAEAKHGTVLVYGLGQYIFYPSEHVVGNGHPKKRERKWGLCYLTDSGFYFYHFPQQNWISSMFNQKGSEEYSLEIPYPNIQKWRAPLPSRFWQRMVHQNDNRLLIHAAVQETKGKKEDSRTVTGVHACILDLRQQLFIDALREYVGDTEYHA